MDIVFDTMWKDKITIVLPQYGKVTIKDDYWKKLYDDNNRR